MMKAARWVSLLVALVLLAAACDDGGAVDVGDGEPSRGSSGARCGSSATATSRRSTRASPTRPSTSPCSGAGQELYSFDSRIEGERSLQPVPDLADGPYQLSDDGRTYTFKLRRGVSTPAGQPRGPAEDFVYAIERQLDPEHARPTRTRG